MKKLSLTIGIPAHNEEHTIAELLSSLIKQKQITYTLKKIIVLCDGCSDTTPYIVSRYQISNPSIICMNEGKRLGKSRRLTQLMQSNTSDVFLTIDADVAIVDTRFLEKIIRSFTRKNTGVVGICDVPFVPVSFFGSIVTTSVLLWDEIRHTSQNRKSIHCIHGQAMALRKSLAKQIVIPKNVFSDDEFIYLRAKELGYDFTHSCSSIVFYQPPTTLLDFFRQASRFLQGRKITRSYFPNSLSEYQVAPLTKYRALASFFRKEPVFLPLALMLQTSLRFVLPLYTQNYNNGFWNQILSTKTTQVESFQLSQFMHIRKWRLAFS